MTLMFHCRLADIRFIHVVRSVCFFYYCCFLPFIWIGKKVVWGVFKDTEKKKQQAERGVLLGAKKKGKLEKYGVVDLAAELKKFEDEVEGEPKTRSKALDYHSTDGILKHKTSRREKGVKKTTGSKRPTSRVRMSKGLREKEAKARTRELQIKAGKEKSPHQCHFEESFKLAKGHKKTSGERHAGGKTETSKRKQMVVMAGDKKRGKKMVEHFHKTTVGERSHKHSSSHSPLKSNDSDNTEQSHPTSHSEGEQGSRSQPPATGSEHSQTHSEGEQGSRSQSPATGSEHSQTHSEGEQGSRSQPPATGSEHSQTHSEGELSESGKVTATGSDHSQTHTSRSKNSMSNASSLCSKGESYTDSQTSPSQDSSKDRGSEHSSDGSEHSLDGEGEGTGSDLESSDRDNDSTSEEGEEEDSISEEGEEEDSSSESSDETSCSDNSESDSSAGSSATQTCSEG